MSDHRNSTALPTVSIGGMEIYQIAYRDEPIVTFAMIDEIHQRTDGTARRNFNDNRTRFLEGEDFIVLDQPDEIRSLGFERPQGGTPASVNLITRRGYLKLTKPMNDDRAWEVQGEMVDRYFAVDAARSDSHLVVPNFSDPVAAARAWADQYEARQIAERTKAEIGTRREATAMNTASQAVKKASRLELELDRSRQYASVKRMSMLYHGQEFEWRMLKSVSVEMGIPAIDVFDANYGTVKAYHANVWREAYALEIPLTAIKAAS